MTLFSKTFFDDIRSDELPFHESLLLLDEDSLSPGLKGELYAFTHANEHDISVEQPRGMIAGNITVCVNGQTRSLGVEDQPFQLPYWLESDGFVFRNCDFEFVLLVENGTILLELMKSSSWKQGRFLIATGSGLPRLGMRRFLHRVSREHSKKVAVLADLSSWGFQHFSILKRGVINPAASCPYTAVSNAVYLGLKPSDRWFASIEENLAAGYWKTSWIERVSAMREYDCFASTAWQTQLDLFISNRRSVKVVDLIRIFGADRIAEFAVDSFTNGNVLE